MDVAAWLREHGLERYEPVFRDSEIDWEVLSDLTDADLKDLGIPLGPRKKLLRAIAALEADQLEGVEGPSAAPRDAERRQLTVLFCDLVGSTMLAERLDPEDLGRLMRDYARCCTAIVKRWEGQVAKFLGDGVLCYFGWPRAHEDDAERAVRAGLDMVRAVAELRAPDDQPLACRVGIATGLVVVGDLVGEGAAQEEAVVGTTPNLAARLQSLAPGGAIVIAEGTHRLVGELFELEPLGPQALAGFAMPQRVWQVGTERRGGSRFEALHGERLTAFVGRGQELALLLDRWRRAKDGEGQVVLLSGEAGIGKSRIAHVLMERLKKEYDVSLRYQCSPHRTSGVLHPFVQQLTHAARFNAGEPVDVATDKLEALLARGTDDLARAVPLIAELISISTDERYPPLDLTPAQRKGATFEVLMEQLEGLAKHDPVFVLFEDMHWADPTSRELWDLTIPRIAGQPILVLITYRPELSLPWGDHGHVTALSLNRLGRQQMATMVTHLWSGKEPPPKVLDQILDRGDGNPLFVEELTRAALEGDLAEDVDGPTASLSPLHIPATLQDSLIARLDRLIPAKEVAQLGAAIGRTFGHRLLATVAALDERVLRRALDQLVGSGIVHRRDGGSDPSYVFKHALVRDAAYQSLLKAKRQDVHRRIARAIEQRFPKLVEDEPDVVAHHFAEAGLAGEAAAHGFRAGRRALDISAYREAIDHLDRALELLRTLPTGPECDARELEIQLALGAAWIAAKAYSTDEVRRAYETAVDLSHRVGSVEQRFAALRGLWNNHLMRVELRTARELVQLLRAAAEESGDPEHRLVAERAEGTVLMALGEHREANACFRRGNDLYEPERHRGYVRSYGEDPGLWCYGYAAWTGDWLGYRDRAIEQNKQAIEIARELPTPNMLAMVLSNSATLHQFRRDVDPTLASAAETIQIADRLGVVQFRTWASIHKGWALACGGQIEDGLAEIETALATWRAIGGLNNRTHFLNLLSECCRLAGRFEAGMAALDEADDLATRFDLHAHDVETHRRRGELHLALGRGDEAEDSWRRAIELARARDTKTLELRAATDLARLWRVQNKDDRAHDLLAPIYGWFTEGFDTQDLKDAALLLEELRSANGDLHVQTTT